MFRHIVLFRWRPEASTAERTRAVEAIHGLKKLPGVVALEAGTDAGLANSNADVGVVVDFRFPEDYPTYATHPEHQRVIAEYIRPILAERTAVQFEL